MAEPRWDPLGRRWILLAPERATRPGAAARREHDSPEPAPCDFCEGREERTPPETYAIRNAGSSTDGPGWRVRAFANLYPATPFHEVVVHSPGHDDRLEDLPRAHVLDVMRVIGARLDAAARATECALAVLNRGRAAGASRSHDHSQVVGLPMIGPAVEREAEAFATRPCVLCDLAADAPLVASYLSVRVVAHPAPLVAHELLIVPSCASSMPAGGEELVAFAAAVGDALGQVRRSIGPAFNAVIHIAPTGAAAFHWHCHVFPRTGVWAGVELGAELPVVAADPAQSATVLRQGP